MQGQSTEVGKRRGSPLPPPATTCTSRCTVSQNYGAGRVLSSFLPKETDEESIFTPVTQLIRSGHRDILWAPLCTRALAVGTMTHTTAPGLGERKAPSLSFQHLHGLRDTELQMTKQTKEKTLIFDCDMVNEYAIERKRDVTALSRINFLQQREEKKVEKIAMELRAEVDKIITL